jgi:hypothetical protein
MADRYSMNTLIRSGGRGTMTGRMPGDPMAEETSEATAGSQDFTVQPPGTLSPTDQFIYEPYTGGTEGAWVVYPPGVPCDTGTARISRVTPADTGDFPKMQKALDEETGEPGDSSGSSGSSSTDPLADILPADTGSAA